jgi:hypothetical protein
MTKNILSQVFVVIRMTLITLLIPCAIKMLGTRGWFPKYSNITPNNVYHVYFIHLTSLVIYNGLQTTDMTMMTSGNVLFVVAITKSNLDEIS